MGKSPGLRITRSISKSEKLTAGIKKQLSKKSDSQRSRDRRITVKIMQTINWKGHGAMFGANAIWGLMSPVAKFVMLGGIVTPLAVTDLRIVGAMILFWILSFFRKSEHVPPKDLAKLFGASLLGRGPQPGQASSWAVGMTSPVKRLDHHHEHGPFVGDDSRRNFPQGTDHREKGTRHRRRSLGSLAVGPRQRKYGQCRRALRRGRPAGPVRAVELRTLLRVVQEFSSPVTRSRPS